jgi:hypothetical protein
LGNDAADCVADVALAVVSGDDDGHGDELHFPRILSNRARAERML